MSGSVPGTSSSVSPSSSYVEFEFVFNFELEFCCAEDTSSSGSSYTECKLDMFKIEFEFHFTHLSTNPINATTPTKAGCRTRPPSLERGTQAPGQSGQGPGEAGGTAAQCKRQTAEIEESSYTKLNSVSSSRVGVTTS